MRKFTFENDKYYHIYNRGVDKRDIFLDKWDYINFLESMREFNTDKQVDSLYRLRQLKRSQAPGLLRVSKADRSSPGATHGGALVDIICYALIPNHFHFLLKQIQEGGISRFMQKIGQGLTNRFNKKYNRSGSLFGSGFKAVQIKSDGHLQRISCYINGNPEIHGLVEGAEDWEYSSYRDYLGLRKGTLSKKEIILKDFGDIKEYKELTDLVIKESKELKADIKKLRLCRYRSQVKVANTTVV